MRPQWTNYRRMRAFLPSFFHISRTSNRMHSNRRMQGTRRPIINWIKYERSRSQIPDATSLDSLRSEILSHSTICYTSSSTNSTDLFHQDYFSQTPPYFHPHLPFARWLIFTSLYLFSLLVSFPSFPSLPAIPYSLRPAMFYTLPIFYWTPIFDRTFYLLINGREKKKNLLLYAIVK